MAKTVQISASPIGEKHVALVALQDDGSMWAMTYNYSDEVPSGSWVRLPAIATPDDDIAVVP